MARPKKYTEDMHLIAVRIPVIVKHRVDAKAKLLGLTQGEAITEAARFWVDQPQHPTLVKRAEYLERGDTFKLPGVALVNPPTSFVLKEDLHEVDGDLVAELEPAELESAIAVVNDHMRSVGLEVPDEVETRPWLPELEKIAMFGEDLSSAHERWTSLAFEAGISGKDAKFPSLNNKAEIERHAKALDRAHPLGVR